MVPPVAEGDSAATTAAEAFGVDPPPWYRDGLPAMPFRYRLLVGAAAFAVPTASSLHDPLLALTIATVVFGVLPWALGRRWRSILRDREEQLMPGLSPLLDERRPANLLALAGRRIARR